MKVLVCGGRSYNDGLRLSFILSHLHITEIIHGAAKGADTLAGCYARVNGIKEVAVKADWDTYGASAGPIRNQVMLDLKPDMVVAFPGGSGTKDMVTRAKAAGIFTAEVE